MKTWVKVKAFILKYWYIIVGISAVVIISLLTFGRSNNSLKKWRDIARRVDEVNDRRDQKLDEIRVEREERVRQIEEEHAETIEQLTEKQKKEIDELRHDPHRLNRRLNSFLPK